MITTIDGITWRLRFEHHRFVRGKHGSTWCRIERWVENLADGGTVTGWELHTNGTALCGRKDNFIKETGRQFALLRALQASGLPKATKAALITAYLKSGSHEREMCDDLWQKGHTGNFYKVGLSEAKEMRV